MKAHEFRASMTLLLALLFVGATSGCVDDENSSGQENSVGVAPIGDSVEQDDVADVAPTDEMLEQGFVTIASGTVENDFVDSGYPMSAVNASLKLVMSSSAVSDIFEVNPLDLPSSPLLDPSQACYSVSRVGWSVEFDFTGCSAHGLNGKITVAKKFTGLFSGPILLTFKDGFAIKSVALSGSLGLTRVAGKQLTFNVFTADLDGERGTPLTVEYLDKDITATARLNGKVKLSLLSAELLFWGIASTTVEGVTSTVYLGGTSEDEVKGIVPPGKAIAYKLLPFDCYCPSRGVMSGNVTLDVGEIEFDLDDFTPENGTDDYPSFTIPVNVDGSYTATVIFRDCGEMKVQLHVDNETPIDLSIGIDAILAALEQAHASGLIPDDLFTEMKAIIANFQGYVPSLQITVGDVINTISGALDQFFYVPFCAVNY